MGQEDDLFQTIGEVFSWSSATAVIKSHTLYPWFFGICGGTRIFPSPIFLVQVIKEQNKKNEKK